MFRRYDWTDFIVTGRPQSVQKLVQEAANKGRGVSEKRALQTSHRGADVRFALLKVKDIAAEADVAMGMVQRLFAMIKSEKLAAALEPDCSTGDPFLQEANPWSLEGDPWSLEGDPWSLEGDSYPMVTTAGATPAEGSALFWNQPAFRKIGLVGMDGIRLPSLACHTGEGVVVGIFDTLPSQPVNLPWLTLHPSAVPLVTPTGVTPRDFSDHGLVAASLIYAVAPQAEVHLYEVLTKEAFGTMFPLLEALSAFIDLAAGRPAVINLSLGSLCCGSASPALDALLRKATDLGMVVCASAGNRGKAAKKVSTVGPAQMPAMFPNVIAVSASSLEDHRATYSQRGDIAAPGGEDLDAPGPGDTDDIIGMGVSDPAGQPSGYVIFDAGTSFSTPMVAGASALVVAHQLQQGATLSPNTYEQVMAALKAGARPASGSSETLENTGLGAGVLYLPNTLPSC